MGIIIFCAMVAIFALMAIAPLFKNHEACKPEESQADDDKSTRGQRTCACGAIIEEEGEDECLSCSYW